MFVRSAFIAASLGLAAAALPASAQIPGGGVKELLGQASDNALDKLAKPGAFSADSAIRIALPGAGKSLGGLMGMASKAGIGSDINGALNHAAEVAAGQAKPIFRAAIDKASFSDAVGVLRGGNTGATDYLKKSTATQIKAQLLPLVKAALDQTGVTQQTSQLKAFGMDENKLTDYVTGKTSDGIFTYVGREETKARKDPLGSGSALLKGLK